MTPDVDQHLRRARELLEVSEENLRSNHPADSVSRAYYAMLHAATAVLKNLGIERKSHHGTWAAFGEHVTGKGLIDRKFHRFALDTFSQRSMSDYLSSPPDTPESASQNLEMAREFVAACRALLAKGGEE